MFPRGGRSRARPVGDVRRHRPDYGIVLLVGLLLIIGLIIIYAISPGLSHLRGNVGEDYYMTKQLLAIGLGVGMFAFTALLPLPVWRQLAPWLIIGAGVSTLLLLIPGARFNDPINGATRWIQLGPVSFQPAELVKFALLVNGSLFLSRQAEDGLLNSWPQTLKPFSIALAATSFVVAFLQRDMGSTMVIVAIMAAMIYVAGLRLKYLLAMAGSVAGAMVVTVALFPHRLERLFTFLHPEADASGAGYHISQALIAIGSGGIVGQGLGRSVQAFGYLPEAANDSIFAVYAEKFGFIGSVLLIALFGMLLMRTVSIIERTPDMFARLMATGIFAWIASHVLINMGAMLGLMPLKGITLPFVSYGGSSLLFTMGCVGLLLQISRYTVPKARMHSLRGGSSENTRFGGRDRRSRYTHPGRYGRA